MPQVTSFVPDERQRLDATLGRAWEPLVVLILCGAGLAILWWLWAADLRLDDDPSEVAAVAVIVLFLGFAAAWSAVALLRRLIGRGLRRTARFEPTDTPRVGEPLRGLLHLSWPLRRDESVVALLECRVQTASPNEGWSDAPAFLWWWERAVDAPVAAVDTRVALAMPIPAEAPASGTYQIVRDSDRRVTWDLIVSIEPSGLTLPFVVSVAPAGGAPRHVSDTVTSEAFVDSDARPAGSQITVRTTGDGQTQYTFRRHASTAALAWWVILSAPLWVLPWLAWREGDALPWSVVGMLLIAAVLNGLPLLFLMQPRQLRIAPDGIRFHRRLLRPRRWHLRDMRGTIVKPVMPGRRPLFVLLQQMSGEPMPICHCQSVAEARWFARDLERALAAAREQRTRAVASS